MPASSPHRSKRRTVVAERLEDLVAPLVDVLGSPLDDPMAPEWIAVPSSVLQRWLSLQLAGHLGAVPGRADGVSANIAFARPPELWWIVLDADDRRRDGRPAARPEIHGTERPVDRWSVEAVTWHVLAVGAADPPLATVAGASEGRVDLAWARRVAQILTGYDRTRPAMVRAWAAGDDTGPDGLPLPVDRQWQPCLWRAVRARIGEPGPAERLPGIIGDLAAGRLDLPLPDRIGLFAPTTLPGGSNYVELLDAVAAHRRVDVYVALPSAALLADDSQLDALVRDDGRTILRRDERARFRGPDAPGIHPLLDSWAGTAREAALLLGPRARVEVLHADPTPPTAPVGVLAALQTALRSGDAPEPVPGAGTEVDVSFHGCTGTTRQAEVLRDALVHLLDGDDTLTEEDVLVVCPDPDRFSPVIRAAFATPAGADGAPQLLASVGQATGGSVDPVVEAMHLLVTTTSGPFRAGEMVAFCALAPVARRYGFDDDDLAQLSTWMDHKHVRWGLTPANRAVFGVPEDYRATTFRNAVDSLLVGLALPGGHPFAGVPADRASGSRSSLIGSFADLVSSLTAVADLVDSPAAPRAALATVRSWVARFLRVDDRETRSLEALLTTLTRTAEQLEVAGIDETPPVTPGDLVRHVVSRHRSGRSTSHLLRGGIDVAGLRSGDITPHRVVAIVGLDEGALAGSRVDGDDLTMIDARIGDVDPRAEARGALLDAITSARDHLIVIRDGTDVRTGDAVEPPVVVAELHEAIAASVSAPAETTHPRHAADPTCFTPTTALRGTDPAAFEIAKRQAAHPAAIHSDIDWSITDPDVPSTVTLDDLHRFFDNPTKFYLQRSVDLRLDGDNDELADTLPVAIDALARWKLEDAVLASALQEEPTTVAGDDDTAGLDRFRRRLGTDGDGLPVGRLGTAEVHAMHADVEHLLSEIPADLRHPAVPTSHEIAIRLPDGGHLGGTVGTFASGGCRIVRDVTPSRSKPADRLRAWTTLAALVAHDPTVDWRVRTVRRPERGEGVVAVTHRFASGAPDERRASAIADLGVAMALWRFGLGEPLPYFAKVSPAAARDPGRVAPGDWHGAAQRPGDGDDVHVGFVYGDLDLTELLALPLRSRDRTFLDTFPPAATTGRDDRRDGDRAEAEPGRVEAFARLLWSRIDASLETVEVDG